MGLRDEIDSEVKRILNDKWTERDGNVVPSSEDIKLGNDAVKLEGTVLYADLDDSTSLVDNFKPWFAAEIYKSFLYGAAKVIRHFNGEITAYAGDRIMAVFIGDSKNTNAGKTALKINYLAKKIINPLVSEKYPKASYAVKHVVGIDTSPLFIARTGIRGSNDLVWVGRAANYAAKLTELPASYPSRITKSVYDMLNKSVKVSNDGRYMWESVSWSDMNNIMIYRSTWLWSF
jgi:class 3 adenylate cyclase